MSGVPGRHSRLDILNDLGGRLKKETLAALVNGVAVDLTYPLHEDAEVRFLTFNDEEGRDIYRHSSSHILAAAVKRLFPEIWLGIGPAIKDGFYYDFDRQESFVR